MIPIEVCVLAFVMAFGMVGLSRTISRELGATAGFVALLLAFEILGVRIGPAAEEGLSAAGFDVGQDLAAWIAYTAAIAATAFLVYQGETLTYPAIGSPGVAGKVFDLSVGMLNGWLAVGTWWYYTDRLDYPIARLGMFSGPLTPRAERLVSLTPVALLPSDRALMYLAAALVVLLALKVLR
ncbi:MAG: hypothetical protein ACE5EL_07780 [Anaerolineae bacterium]